MAYQIEYRNPTVEEYRLLRASAGWNALGEEQMARGLAGSLFGVVIMENGGMVASARVVGDGAIYFYVQDVVVLEGYRGKGLGKMLMDEVEDYLSKAAGPKAFVGLMAARDVEEFYVAYGYARRPENGPGMFKVVE